MRPSNWRPSLVGPVWATDLNGLRYRAAHCNYVPPTVSRALWAALLRPDNIIRVETATALGRAAVEPLSENLLAEFGHEVARPEVKQLIGRMVREIMQALGYEVDRKRLRITRLGLFATGIVYRRGGGAPNRHGRGSADARRAWLSNATPDSFNRWLDNLVNGPDGTVDPERLRQIAQARGVEKQIRWGNASLDRLQLGVVLRSVVDPSEYASPEDELTDEADESRRQLADESEVFGTSAPSRADVEAIMSGYGRSRR